MRSSMRARMRRASPPGSNGTQSDPRSGVPLPGASMFALALPVVGPAPAARGRGGPSAMSARLRADGPGIAGGVPCGLDLDFDFRRRSVVEVFPTSPPLLFEGVRSGTPEV
jgi:hypothetical protein